MTTGWDRERAEVLLHPAAGYPDLALDDAVPEVVAEIEGLLARAKAGEVRAVGWAVVLRDQRTDADWFANNYSAPLFAAASDLAFRLGYMRMLSAFDGTVPGLVDADHDRGA